MSIIITKLYNGSGMMDICIIHFVSTNVYYEYEYVCYIAIILAFEYKVEYLIEWTIIVLVAAANVVPLINFLTFVKLP